VEDDHRDGNHRAGEPSVTARNTRSRGTALGVVTLGAAAVLSGCAGGAPATATHLVVLVSGLPAGVDAAVTVRAASSEHLLSAGAVLELAPGTYSIDVAPVVGDEPIARTVYDGGADHATVELAAAATETVSVEYVRRPGSGRAWVRATEAVLGFEVGAWGASGSASPTVTLPLPQDDVSGFGIALSPVGDLYVGLLDGGVARYAAADLDTDGAQPSGVALRDHRIARVAFHDGRLYLMAVEGNMVFRVDDPASIVGEVDAPPDATMTIVAVDDLTFGTGLAFDDSGRLWVALYSAMMRIDEPWAPVGAVEVQPDAALVHAVGARMAFTYRDGSLYVGRFDSDDVLRYDGVDSVQGTHTVTHSASIGVGEFHIGSIAFDASGRFWLGSNTRLARYPDLAALADGSTVTANVVITHVGLIHPAVFNVAGAE
jgi:hypothetical protein